MLKKLIISASLSIATFANAEIVIGQSVPTTGIAAETGKAIALGASLYFNSINGRGGINGELINHIVRDDAYDAQKTLKNTQDFIEKENAVALISYFGTSGISELIKTKTLEHSGIPLVGVHSGAESIRNPGNLFIFNTRSSYNQETDRLIKLLVGNLGVTKIAVVAEKGEFGDAGVAALKASLEKHQLKLAGEAWYDNKSGDTNKAAQELAKMNPEAIIIVALSKPAASFVQQYKEKGGTSQLYSLSPVQFEEVAKTIGKKGAHGLGISQAYPYPYNTRSKLIQEFQAAVFNEMGTGSGKEESKSAIANYPSYAMLEGYISARLIVEAIKRAGKTPTRSSIYNALTTMKKYDLGGFTIDYSDKNRNGSSFGEITMMSPTGALSR
ncbi:ABC transporter substrate-binding protein [Deefgea salmonis]|uniref:ABC transporter substrate-binding protein n=1 Tax=Deefgea salmonis TaxID=2875502 RepID=A0ABS8BNI5_9NEIS|nr:ABC transporter substrate-binding protein [Deefgea salmonis]MCB5197101.1 ABC transporter substrate-binding protein [Deefgea salmonis]